MNVATIGSGVIVDRMIEAMRLDGRYNLYCVYSRTKKRAKEFAEKHGIQKYYTDMEEMLNDENVDIVPSNISLAGINSKLESAMCRETVLKRFIDTVKDDYDYVIIDTNPSLDNLPINALTASDKVVITVQAEPYAVEGMADLLRSINMVRRNLNHDLKIEGVLITMTNERTNLSKKITHEVRENFGGHIKVFDTTIPRCTKAAESTGIGESIFQYDPKGAATKAYEAFTKEVILNAEKEHKRHKSSYVR